MLTPDNVFLAVKPVDMRRGIDTLTQYIQDELKSTWHGKRSARAVCRNFCRLAMIESS
ncbi:TPA: transposase [Salmonella enterica]|uniref:Transposase n=1 Tax=Salmonella enterica TaxID=28901 RepID=A0A757VVI2_SALER|nr:transposase [Salmonella enterica]